MSTLAVVAVMSDPDLESVSRYAPAAVGDSYAHWGMLAAIDLHDCDNRQVASADAIRTFLQDLIPAIGMTAFGPARLERFGEGELEGWSAIQFIHTSTVTVHADEVGNRCYVDIFSCKDFDPEIAEKVAVTHFGGQPMTRVLLR